MAQITIVADIAIPNGPRVGFNRTLPVEAFDKIDVTVPAGPTELQVQLQPGGAGMVQLLLIVADWYGANLTYRVPNLAPDPANPVRTLDQPHLFAGTGAVSTLHATAFTSLVFRNATSGTTARDANVQILIGRDATP